MAINPKSTRDWNSHPAAVQKHEDKEKARALFAERIQWVAAKPR